MPIRMSTIKKSGEKTSVGEQLYRNGNLCAPLLGLYNITGAMKTMLALPQKLKIE